MGLGWEDCFGSPWVPHCSLPYVHPRLLPSNALFLAAPSPQDSAQYECVVSNEVGESRRRYEVTVHGESWWRWEMWVPHPPSWELSCQQALTLALPSRLLSILGHLL